VVAGTVVALGYAGTSGALGRGVAVHMIKLTQQREIAPYAWVHPVDDDRR
jgi:hypothetical protein